MKNWFASLNGAIVLSFIALLTFLGRTFIDFQFVYNEFAPNPNSAALAMLLNMSLFGGWLWSLYAGVRGIRRGWIAGLIFALLLPFMGGIATLVFFCPSPCATAGGLMEIANWINMITGLLAVIAVGLHLRQTSVNQINRFTK